MMHAGIVFILAETRTTEMRWQCFWMYWCRNIWTSSICSLDAMNECAEHLDSVFTCMLFIMWWWNFCLDRPYFNVMLLLFSNNYYIQFAVWVSVLFCRWSVIFLCVGLIWQNNIVFPVSAPSFFWRWNTNRKINFSVGFSFVRECQRTEK
jgi:hypothetical protein